jgi:hypothetical protein
LSAGRMRWRFSAMEDGTEGCERLDAALKEI